MKNIAAKRQRQFTALIAMACAILLAWGMFVPSAAQAVTGSQVAADGTYSAPITATDGKKTKSATINVVVVDGRVSDLTFSGSDAKDFLNYLMGKKGTAGTNYLDVTASADTIDAVTSATQGKAKYTIDLKSAIKTALANAEEAEQADDSAPFTDGTYTKEFSIGNYTATVTVTVSGGKVTDIAVDNHGNGNWATPLADAKSNLVGQSSLNDIDVIASATPYSQSLEDAIKAAVSGVDKPTPMTYSAPLVAYKTKDGKTASTTLKVTVSGGKIARIAFDGGDATDFDKYLKVAKPDSSKYNTSWYDILVGQPVTKDLVIDATTSASLTGGSTTKKYTTDLQSAILAALDPILGAPPADDSTDKVITYTKADSPYEVDGETYDGYKVIVEDGAEVIFKNVTFNDCTYEFSPDALVVINGSFKESAPGTGAVTTYGVTLSGNGYPGKVGESFSATLPMDRLVTTYSPSNIQATVASDSSWATATVSGTNVTISGTPTQAGTFPLTTITMTAGGKQFVVPIYIVVADSDTPTSTSVKQIAVTKDWDDGASNHTSDEVEVGIYDSSDNLVETIKLNNANSWSATTTTALSNSETYTVKEDKVTSSGNDVTSEYDATVTKGQTTTKTTSTPSDAGKTISPGGSATIAVGETLKLQGTRPSSYGNYHYWYTDEEDVDFIEWDIDNSASSYYYAGTNIANITGVSAGTVTVYHQYISGGSWTEPGETFTITVIDSLSQTTTTTDNYTITNKEAAVEHAKSIEKVKDNEYDINLTVKGKDILQAVEGPGGGTPSTSTKPIDVILLLDYSATMNTNRLANMKTQATSFINKLAQDNGDSKAAVVAYGQYSSQNGHINVNTLNGGWTTLSSGASSLTSALTSQGNLTGDNYSYGTDHGGAYEQAQKLFNNSAVASDNRAKYIVNISDGVFDYSSSPYYSTTEANAMKGNGVTIYYITIGSSADATKVASLATSSGHVYSGGNSGESLASVFSSIEDTIEGDNASETTYETVHMTGVVIKDTLSDNVELKDTAGADISVKDSSGKTLAKDTDYKVTLSGKEVSIALLGELDKDTTYTATIPVKVTQATKDDFKNNKQSDEANYPDTSDTGAKGYFSNDNNTDSDQTKVTLTYKHGDTEKTIPYEEKPVVQVVPDPDTYDYELIYDANGGTGAPATEEVSDETEASYDFTVSSSEPTREGYTFKGWADAADATTAQYKSGDKVASTGVANDTASKTIYAVWEPVKVSITVTKDWADTDYYENGTPINDYKRPDTVTINLTAKDSDGNVLSDYAKSQDIDIAGGKSDTTFADLPIKTTDDKDVTYSVAEASITGWTASGGELQAVYDQNDNTKLIGYETTITNTPDSGSETNSVTLTIKKVDADDTNTTLSGAAFTITKEGETSGTDISATDDNGETTYTFTEEGTYTVAEKTAPTGYQKSSDTWTLVVNKELDKIELKQSLWTKIYKLIFGDSGNDFDASANMLTVKDAKQTYTVTFDRNGHGTDPAAQTVKHGEKATEPTPVPSESGWVFDGWYTDAACTTEYDFGTAVTEDKTLYAKWLEQHGYALNYDANGGTDAPDAQQSGNTTAASYDFTVDSKEPTRDGYTFKGWADTDNATTAKYQAGDKITVKSTDTGKAKTIYAVWEKKTDTATKHNSVTVTKVDEDGTTPLDGAIFELKDGNTVVATYTANPFTISTDDTELTSYLSAAGATKELTLSEKSAPTGYKTSTATYTVKIEASEAEALTNGVYVTTTTYTITIDGEASKSITNEKKPYTIKFVDEDGTVLDTQTVKHGDMPTTPEDPTKAEDAQNTYAFGGWDKEVVAATEDATYTATYVATAKPGEQPANPDPTKEEEPPADEPPADEPPAEDPPANEPLAEDPPVVEEPSIVEEPPVVEEPPAEEPLAEEPPAEEPEEQVKPVTVITVDSPRQDDPPEQVDPVDEIEQAGTVNSAGENKPSTEDAATAPATKAPVVTSPASGGTTPATGPQATPKTADAGTLYAAALLVLALFSFAGLLVARSRRHIR